MKNTPTEKQTEIGGRNLLRAMENNLTGTIAAYDALLGQCKNLAKSMGLTHDYVVRKVMPKNAAERINTKRIKEWFEKVKDDCVAYLLELEAEDERDRERERLLDSLNLTPEQMALLGLAKASPPPVHET